LRLTDTLRPDSDDQLLGCDHALPLRPLRDRVKSPRERADHGGEDCPRQKLRERRGGRRREQPE